MSGQNPKSLRRTLVLAWVTVVLCVIGALAWTNRSLGHQFQSSFHWVTHTQELLQRIEETISLLKDVETGQRGYCLTGEVSYLEPYHHALAVIPANIADLLELTSDNPKEQARVIELHRAIKERIAVAEESVAAREIAGPEAAVTLSKTGRGRTAMDSVRTLAEELKHEEKRLLAERQIAANDSLYRQQIFGITLLALLIAASVAVIWLRRRVTEMENLVRVCAWTNQIEHNGQWIPVEKFLFHRFGIKTSHGMSEKAVEKFRGELELSDPDFE